MLLLIVYQTIFSRILWPQATVCTSRGPPTKIITSVEGSAGKVPKALTTPYLVWYHGFENTTYDKESEGYLPLDSSTSDGYERSVLCNSAWFYQGRDLMQSGVRTFLVCIQMVVT